MPWAVSNLESGGSGGSWPWEYSDIWMVEAILYSGQCGFGAGNTPGEGLGWKSGSTPIADLVLHCNRPLLVKVKRFNNVVALI